jgi:dephospho-CoA kinase
VAWEASDSFVNPNPAPESNHHPYIVALTGGIASGKTLVSDEFARLGVPVIDTDVIAHKSVEPGQPALHEIADVFGSRIIDTNGRLKRSKLRTLIFSDPKAREQLESILHPKIRQEVRKTIKSVTAAYCILVIPLLAENGFNPNANRVLVVDVERDKQISRLIARDNYNRDQAIQALAIQASRQQRLEIADDVLNNSGLPRQARKQVKELHRKYLQLAAHRNATAPTMD